MVRICNWRQWIEIIIFVYMILLITIFPLIFIEFLHQNITPLTQAWFVGGLFVLLALPISFWTILQHLINYTQPNLQRHIIRILWMVPIYAINSWLALRFEGAGIYLDTARECYEAYVILNFFKYLTNYLKVAHPFLESDLARKRQIRHLPPICCLPPWKMGRQFINQCRHGVVQYTVLRIVTTCVAFICAMCGEKFYGEGDFNFRSAWSYLIIINNVSQIYAMYCLIMFYKATQEELRLVHPVGKFICVKFVVFLSFWQSLLITGLVNMHLIVLNDLTNAQTSNAIQNTCICVEMFFAAIGHFYSFPYSPFVDQSNINYQNKSCFKSFKSMWDVSDVRKDLTDHITYVGSSATNMLRSEIKNNRRDKQENHPLLDDSMDAAENIPLNIVSTDTELVKRKPITLDTIAAVADGGDHFTPDDITDKDFSGVGEKDRRHNLHIVTIKSFDDDFAIESPPYFNLDRNVPTGELVNLNPVSVTTVDSAYDYRKLALRNPNVGITENYLASFISPALSSEAKDLENDGRKKKFTLVTDGNGDRNKSGAIADSNWGLNNLIDSAGDQKANKLIVAYGDNERNKLSLVANGNQEIKKLFVVADGNNEKKKLNLVADGNQETNKLFVVADSDIKKPNGDNCIADR